MRTRVIINPVWGHMLGNCVILTLWTLYPSSVGLPPSLIELNDSAQENTRARVQLYHYTIIQVVQITEAINVMQYPDPDP